MSVNRGNSNFAASVSHTEKQRKKKWLYLNAKSCMAMAVSAALLFTSVDGIAVRAEELSDMVLPVTEEEKPAASEKPETSEESLYLKNAEGAVIISSFEALQEKESHIELEERKTLEEVRELMPKTLTANLTRAVSPGEDNGQSGEGGTPPGQGNSQTAARRPLGKGNSQTAARRLPGKGNSQAAARRLPGKGNSQAAARRPLGKGNSQAAARRIPGQGISRTAARRIPVRKISQATARRPLGKEISQTAVRRPPGKGNSRAAARRILGKGNSQAAARRPLTKGNSPVQAAMTITVV